jgi:hypothetical protein
LYCAKEAENKYSTVQNWWYTEDEDVNKGL